MKGGFFINSLYQPPLVYRSCPYFSKLNQLYEKDASKQEYIESHWKFMKLLELTEGQDEYYPINQIKRYWQLLDYSNHSGQTFLQLHAHQVQIPPAIVQSFDESYLSVYQVVGLSHTSEMLVEDVFSKRRINVSARDGELYRPWTLLIARVVEIDNQCQFSQEILNLSPSYIQLFREVGMNLMLPDVNPTDQAWIAQMKKNGLQFVKPLISFSPEHQKRNEEYYRTVDNQVDLLLSGGQTVHQYIRTKSPYQIDVLKLYDYLQWRESIADHTIPPQSGWMDALQVHGRFEYNDLIGRALRTEIHLTTKVDPEDIQEMINELKRGIEAKILPTYLSKIVTRIERFNALSIEDFQMVIESLEKVRHYFEEYENELEEKELDERNKKVAKGGHTALRLQGRKSSTHIHRVIDQFLLTIHSIYTQATVEKYVTHMELLKQYIAQKFEGKSLATTELDSPHFIELCAWWHIVYSWVTTKTDRKQLLVVTKKFIQFLDQFDGRNRYKAWKEVDKALREQLLKCSDFEKLCNQHSTTASPTEMIQNMVDGRKQLGIFTIHRLILSSPDTYSVYVLCNGEEWEAEISQAIVLQLEVGYSFKATYEWKDSKAVIHDLVTFFPPLALPFLS